LNLPKEKAKMKRFAVHLLFAHFVVLFAGLLPAAEAPTNRVVVMYFHRTERCPTCQRMGGYSEEAVKTAFAEQMKTGQVALHDIDFQAAQNARYVKAYRIAGPTLIVAKITDNKVETYRNLDEIWSKVRDKGAFFRYVQENVEALLPQ
jgi:hypothetical protein